MIIRRKFVVVDTRGTVPSSEDPPCAIDRVRIQHDNDLRGENRLLEHWSTTCATGDVFKTGDGFVYVCAVMWTEDKKKQTI